MRLLIVTGQDAGQRLDKYLGKYLNLAGKSFLYKMMRKKNITLNDKKCDGSEKIKDKDQIKMFLAEETIEKFSSVEIQKVSKKKLDLIYEDDHILLINKPAGMLSQKAKDTDESLVEYLIDYLMESNQLTIEDLRGFRPSVCNRLDRNTSGLVAAGKTMAGLQILGEIFKDRSLHKYYLCIIAGALREGRRIEGFLKKDEKTNQVTVLDRETKDSLPIVTEYEPLAHNDRYTLLKVALITGRSHQIRAHLASIGFPIVGDTKYGNAAANKMASSQYRVTSQMLHAYRVVFPTLREPLADLSGRAFEAPLPPVFETMLKGEGLWEPGIPED